MLKNVIKPYQNLAWQVILIAGMTLLISISALSYSNLGNQENILMDNIIIGADRLGNTIKLGTRYAMNLNSREDIQHIISNVSEQRDIESLRIYNKEGKIKFTNRPDEIDLRTNIKDEACYVCHRTEPPQIVLEIHERTRIFQTEAGQRFLGIIIPIYNEPGCSTNQCHAHPENKKVLGALDVVFSLAVTDRQLFNYKAKTALESLLVLLLTSAAIMATVLIFIRKPMKRLSAATQQIAEGGPFSPILMTQKDEMGQLAAAINHMAREIADKQDELNRQKEEYQQLFEEVPCIITVQDRNYRLIKYNREFSEKFMPTPFDFCFHSYKDRDSRCLICPVEKTFQDGLSHTSEEAGYYQDGTKRHWLVKTSPIKDAAGQTVAAMEVCLDITGRKELEEKLFLSEKKYHAIFNNIPNPVFVLNHANLQIVDMNESVTAVYGFQEEELLNKPFLNLFSETEKDGWIYRLRTSSLINQVRHKTKDGRRIFVDIRISPSEYPGLKVLLVTTADITKRLETEQQLIQTSKMATLGEMATGVAHELNQPLSVIKIASSFFMKKVKKKENIPTDILYALAEEIDQHVDRASKIINHLRAFGRKSLMEPESIQVNDPLGKALDILGQQFNLHEIEVVWQLEENLPPILADQLRLEQVFINLLINARDAIEERWSKGEGQGQKKIVLSTRSVDKKIIVEVSDNGVGIPPALQNKIFEPFFTTKEVGKGTGLGLSISYGFIKECGGNIRMESNAEGGATFVIEFPHITESS
ncbi:MAG: PAS domain S-box protein [Deltaproteobacteria bacterium]|nr:PAS domain S-box protein [Deltaproteobacteria bacterium]